MKKITHLLRIKKFKSDEEYEILENQLNHKLTKTEKEEFKNLIEDKHKFVLPWMIGGLGTATLSNKSNAKSVKTCPLKCPTFNEAQKVS